ncbi:MAG: adenylate/guanylate cyclase domain-containing protein [Candidatus Wallbacteria bacterium]|nr:adenylate/guanylate cyclase domain-containing protein [Candidatus Wallbacteria bacterium]
MQRSLSSFDAKFYRIGAVLALTAMLGLPLESWWGVRLLDLGRFDFWLRDVVAAVTPPPPGPPPAVSIAAIDESSLRRLGRWPWPWDTHARIVDQLTRLGARCIVFDVVLFSPPGAAPPSGASDLVGALRRSGRVLLGAGVETGRGLEPDRPILPAAILGDAARAVGLVVFPRDADGTVRRFFPFGPVPVAGVGREPGAISAHSAPSLESATLPAMLDTLAAALHLGAPLPARPAFDGSPIQEGESLEPGPSGSGPARLSGSIRLQGRLGPSSVPLLDDGHTALIRFRTDPNAVTVFSCSDLLSGGVAEAKVRSRTVYIGYTAELMQDSFPVPGTAITGQRMPGVEIHAHAAGTLISGQALALAKASTSFTFRYGAALTVGLAVALAGPLPGLLLLVSLQAGLLFNACRLFQAGTVMELGRPIALPAAVYVVCLISEYTRQSRRAAEIRKMFSHYLNPSVVQWLVSHPGALRLGGESRELTVLFSDIRGFTSLSEKLGPERLVALLNDYLSRMTEIVFRHEGTLDKYIGDALMAFFGAPVEQPDHAERCCRAALQMLVALESFNRTQRDAGGAELAIGIGINTGEMIVGNMGSIMRFDYTVMGDAVNLASRLEGQTKPYGVQLIVGERTRTRLGRRFLVRELDSIRVKGKLEPARIFELLGTDDEVPEARLRAAREFEAGLACYRQQRWEVASERFEAALRDWPKDGPSLLFAQRCRAFAAAPPANDWDGVYVATTK